MPPIEYPEYPHSDSTAQNIWLDELGIEIGKLEVRDGMPVPDGFVFDYSPASLPVLEAAALEYQDQPGHASRIDLYIRGLGAYLGEAILFTAGGYWDRSEDEGEDPVVIVDPVHKAGPVAVCDIVRTALSDGTGGMFAEEHGWMQIAADAQREKDPAWRPVKADDGIDRPKAG
ncbi:hypothetical protein AB0D04_16160 [Streptomyces sp. NPDC048483]|uniref:hypothetical protein n=1 Tax=Streptomyces sp. NPDC048483 TaxID=3154927 RepID=UPI00344A8631